MAGIINSSRDKFNNLSKHMAIRELTDKDNVLYAKFINPIDFANFSCNHIELWIKVQGAIINHSEYGVGKIIRIEQRSNYIPLIYVLFENENEERTFNSDGFKSGIIETMQISNAQNEEFQEWKKQYEQDRQQKCNYIQTRFVDFGVNSLWHMTHNENVINILEHGIMNHYDAKQFERVDISDPGAQRWRECVEPCFNRKIHEYAPLF